MEHENKQFKKASELVSELKSGIDPYPQIIEIHPTYKCNHRCIYCFNRGVKYNSLKKFGFLKIIHYKSLFKEMNYLSINDLSISGGGEPTMSSRLPTLIKEAHKKSLNIRMVSNGSFMSNKLLNELKKVSEIRFSIDAIHAETYAKIHNVPDVLFKQTLENIKKVINLKEKGLTKINIGLTFLINKNNYHELVEFCKKMLKLPINEIIVKQDIYGAHKAPTEKLKDIFKKVTILKDSRIHIREQMIMRSKHIQCFVPYFKIAINPYGDTYSCCLGAQPGGTNGYKLGNIKNESFREIWAKSKKLRISLMAKGVQCLCNYTDYQLNILLSSKNKENKNIYGNN